MRLKALHKNNLVKAKKIIADSITDHLVQQVSFLKKTKEMFDSLSKLFEGNNINHKMTLRKELKNVKDPECRDHIVILYKGSLKSKNNLKW